MVAKIKTSKDLNDLNFFILIAGTALTILKTMVFVDNSNERIVLVNHLHNLHLIYMKNDEERIIRIFTSILEPNAKEEYLKDFRNSDTRIWICMDAAGMEVDIRNII